MSARTILKHLHQQGRMTDYQFDVINRNLRERPQGEFTIDELKKWLYEIADNNNNDFGKDCLEIVGRLDGFENFIADMRGGRE